MCGIAGFTSPGRDAYPILAAMNAALAHRGPDADTVFVDSTIAFAHRRLVIIDPTGGAQPRVDRATGDALVFNGEIFGYRKLAAALRDAGIRLRDRSDTEVLFQLLRRDGLRETLDRIDGQFAFAYRDGASGTLYLARDRFGEKPLYYALRAGQLIFGSEASALLAHPALAGVSPDPSATYQFLLFEYIPGSASGWSGINKLEPGNSLTFDGSRATIERYWRPHPAAARAHTDEKAAVDGLDHLLNDAIRDRLVADVPVGVFLSGGIDSSLISAIAARTAPDITAFSVRIDGDGFDETGFAQTVAGALDLKHEIVTLNDSDLISALHAVTARLSEPLGDSSLLPTYLVCRAARQLMTVALGGDGADELFGGYPNFMVQRFAPIMRMVPPALGQLVARAAGAVPGADGYMDWRFLITQLSQGFGASIPRQSFLWMAPFAPADLEAIWNPECLPPDAPEAAFAPVDRLARDVARLGDVDKLSYMFQTTYLPDDILMKTDRASMFNSLEVRAPFLDKAFASYAGNLSPHFKIRGQTRKYILKKLAYRYLPAEIVERKKHGFAVPIDRYLRTIFREPCADLLLSGNNPVARWFRPGVVARMLDAHLSGRERLGKKLWSLYILFAVAGRPRTAGFIESRSATVPING